MKGNEAIAEAAIAAGCDAYFGYPITPQAELLEWMARRMPEEGRVFVQAESELGRDQHGARRGRGRGPGPRLQLQPGHQPHGRGDVLHGRLAAARACSSTSCAAGPGLGSIGAAQGDYLQATKGHGHGDYQRAGAGAVVDRRGDRPRRRRVRPRRALPDAGDPARGRHPGPGDGAGRARRSRPWTGRRPDWSLEGAEGREPRVAASRSTCGPRTSSATTSSSRPCTRRSRRREQRWAGEHLDGAEVVLVAYGTAARVARTAVERARAEGLRAGLFRPITLWPFPADALREAAADARAVMAVEMSAGQLVEDVRLAIEGAVPVFHHGRMGGMVPSPGRGRGRDAPRPGQAARRPDAMTGDASRGTGERGPDDLPAAAAADQPHQLLPRLRARHRAPARGRGARGAGPRRADDPRRLRRLLRVRLRLPALDAVESPHGRAAAVATGVKRYRPDKVVFTYQGDGDLAAIGTAEIVHAAARGERFTTIFVNNGIYGMTGGQMAPTTLAGQKTTSSPLGPRRPDRRLPAAGDRDALAAAGRPVRRPGVGGRPRARRQGQGRRSSARSRSSSRARASRSSRCCPPAPWAGA